MRWLWSATLLVFALGMIRHAYVITFGVETPLRSLAIFSLDGEQTLAAWYSSMLMWSASTLLALHAILSRQQDRRMTAYWWALAVIFAYLSLDETSSIHEYADKILPAAFIPGGFLTFRWLIVAAPVLLIGGLAFVPFLLRLPRSDAWRIIRAGLVFVGGAYGVEHVGGFVLATRGADGFYYATVVIEEGMEMAGLSLFISALLALLVRQAPRLTLRLE